ncbi:MAG: DUF4268 domain-containing protein [Chloroflexota bacterium]|nr:DUF4268 domain-containing protein [Chloroflexota bacterium]
MATKRDLGKIILEDPRSVWEHEAEDFTPWLAEHIDLLGDALGVEIEIAGREEPVGSFAVDLYGTEVGTGRVVIVENQLARTDHTHLGQLLAYAAGLDAKIVVWVSPEVRDEHREAIHWLNSQTSAEVGFFLVELELLRVDESLPAPRFNLAAQPSEFQRELVKETKTERTAKQLAYHDFYVDLLTRLRMANPNFTRSDPANVRHDSWANFSAGRSGFHVGWAFTASGHFRVELYVDTGDRTENKSAFDQLQTESAAIEAAIGEQLTWERLDNRRASRVYAHRNGSVESPETVLEDHKLWAIDLTPRFRDVFSPRIQTLNLGAPSSTEAYEEVAP